MRNRVIFFVPAYIRKGNVDMDIEQLRKLLSISSNIKWAKHCLERMQERDISIADVKSCLQTGEVIEDYPDDYPHPSVLT